MTDDERQEVCELFLYSLTRPDFPVRDDDRERPWDVTADLIGRQGFSLSQRGPVVGAGAGAARNNAGSATLTAGGKSPTRVATMGVRHTSP
jgi:hypothetical protein